MSGIAHIIHFILTILTGGFWLPIWILCALCSGSSKRNKMQKLQEENNKLLSEIARQDKWKGYRD